MRMRDDLEPAAGRRAAITHSAKAAESAGEVGRAISKPGTASVQTMLEVQRLAGNAGVGQLLAREEDRDAAKAGARSPVLDVVGKGGGQPLDHGLRSEMENRLGADFSDVRLHTDQKATNSAKAVQANAYTVGNEVVVRSDRFSPQTEKGKETLAHELTHVVQQRSGPVAGTSTGDGISVSDPGDRFERAAESNASRAMSAPAPAAGASAQLQREAAPEDEEVQGQWATAQREAAPEDEEVQGQWVQREAAPEDEEVQGQWVQREAAPEDEEVQGQWVQREAAPEDEEVQGQWVQRQARQAESHRTHG